MAIRVAAAIILSESGILIAQRAKGQQQEGFWEFPGGKVEPGETEEACLRREILEELGYEIEVTRFFAENVHAYAEKRILLRAFFCRLKGGEMNLTVHDEAAWVDRSALRDFEFAPADVPIVEKLMLAPLP